MESYSIVISGKVQNVYYRKSVSQALQRLQVQGYIQNLSDGRVIIVALIYDDIYELALKAIKEGSPLSNVTDITVEVLENDDIIYDGFEIRV